MVTKKKILGLLLGLFFTGVSAQNPYSLTVQNAHSHNDYAQKSPFYSAYDAGFGSIEADVFLKDGKLLVAHTVKELQAENTLQKLYLDPIKEMIQKNKGKIYANPSWSLNLFVELKTEEVTTLPFLVKFLENYPEIINPNSGVKIIITGNIPKPEKFSLYPNFIFFDGDFNTNYTSGQLKRIGIISSNLAVYTKWNGKGIPRDEEKLKVEAAVTKAHQLKKPVRFWGAPDIVNGWIQLMNLGVDFINTDQIPELAQFLNKLPQTTATNKEVFIPYQPTYRSDKKTSKVKNVILLISDGASLPQYYAAYTANKGNLNIFKMKSTGFSNTNSANAYITDSAPGATAFSTGIKTKNNFVGVDPEGNSLDLLPDILAKKGIKSGLITTGDITDATPAAFYAHSNNRDSSGSILKDFTNSKVSLLMGGPTSGLTPEITALLNKDNISVFSDLKNLDQRKERWILMDPLASKNYAEGRGKWLGESFALAINKLKKNEKGFFMMVEASRTDINGHANQFQGMVTEMLDFDETVGKALQFADENGETLVIVLSDHETGGLSILDGNLEKGNVLANFSTNDHTSLPAVVFAYGPSSDLFTGFYENTEIFKIIITIISDK